jgi:hypothetical protein
VFEGAVARLETVTPEGVQPLGRSLTVTGLAVTAVVMLLIVLPAVPQGSLQQSDREVDSTIGTVAAGDLRVVITPPRYAGAETSEFVNPTSITALEGSQIRLEVRLDATSGVSLFSLEGRDTPFTIEGERAFLEFPATASRPLLVRQSLGTSTTDRLVQLRVHPDERPVVAIREPAKDLVFAAGSGQVALQIEALDDVGLLSLALKYTRVSGSGETFTFEEGEWPIEVVRDGATAWRARAMFSLEQLKLQDGDTLVYRALARDGKPGADPASSDTYLIEIGRLAGVASQGFALPEERDRQAISQQMLIIKTERLHADKDKLSAEAFSEQAQLLAVEQRMVKAEFVFMTGGHVEDEVEEATHAHELAEGRMENSAQVELLAAIREMSRAEARLNAADTTQALQFERAALKALQRAFDRRRYLLRTLPERARIDVTRRLTGELDAARSSVLPSDAPVGDPVLQEARAVLSELGQRGAGSTLSALAARILALAPDSEALQAAALQLTTENDDAPRDAAIRQAQRALIDWLRHRMVVQRRLPLERQPLKGPLVQELLPGGTSR